MVNSNFENDLNTLFGETVSPNNKINSQPKNIDGSLALIDLPNFNKPSESGIDLETIRDPYLRRIYLKTGLINENILAENKFKKHFILAQFNKNLLNLLQIACIVVILLYGLDVVTTADVSKLEEKTRRIVEQNCELSAKLLKVVSFQGIQENLVGRFGLRVPENVIIAKELPNPQIPIYKPRIHYMQIISGY